MTRWMLNRSCIEACFDWNNKKRLSPGYKPHHATAVFLFRRRATTTSVSSIAANTDALADPVTTVACPRTRRPGSPSGPRRACLGKEQPQITHIMRHLQIWVFPNRPVPRHVLYGIIFLTPIRFFLSKMLGTQFGPVGTRFLWFYGRDFLRF